MLIQGDLPKARLLEEFAEDETSCLFATLGFWQGVDIPGRALSLVTIDKLPFPRPDDPLLQARRDRAGGRAFQLVDLPRAATMLAQGAGRLIRTADDRGVVAVLDPRLATASYRGVLLSTLPPMRRSVDRDEVEVFLRRALDRGRLVTETVEHLGPVLPAPLHLHVQIEVGPLGELLAHGDPDRFEHFAALADDDRLLRVALDDDLARGCAATPTR